MIRPGRLLLRLLGLVLLLAGSGHAHADAPMPPAEAAQPVATAPPDPARADRQILVMLRLAPPHLRAGADYGGGYGDEDGQRGRRRIAQRLARAHGLTLVGNWPMALVGVDCFIMAVPDARLTEAVARGMEQDGAVAWSEPVAVYAAQAAPPPPAHNDALYPAQPAARPWALAALHRQVTGRGVRVAVIDSGVDARHPDLVGQVTTTRNFVDGSALVAETHGTAVAGIIAARADNRVGIAGVAPGARILGLRACWQQRPDQTLCDSLSLARAIQAAIESRADVLNMSLGGPPGRLLGTLLRIGLDRGASLVAALDPGRADGGFPASMPGVIAVAAAPRPRAPLQAVFEAPGRDIPAPLPGGTWTLVNGNSFAAAHVSGLLALMRERRGVTPKLVASRADPAVIDICASLRLAGCGAQPSVQ